MNCLDVIFFQAELAPEKLAVVAHGAVISYARLARGIASAERRLAASGLKAGHLVGLDVAHPIDHFVFACALYRMKIASVSLAAALEEYPQNLEFEAVLADNLEVSKRKPTARILFVDTSWFQDPVELSVDERSRARREPAGWIGRVTLRRSGNAPPAIVKTTAAALEAQIIDYWLALAPDWERMISVQSLASVQGFVLALAALTQGRTICLADPGIARELIAVYKHHYLVAAAHELASLVARQGTDFAPLPALRGAFIEGTEFPADLVAACMATISPNTTLCYSHPETGIIAFGAAGRLREVPGAVGVIAPWAEVEIVGAGGEALPSEAEGRLRFRRRTGRGTGAQGSADAAGDTWVHSGQRARRLRNNLLVVTPG